MHCKNISIYNAMLFKVMQALKLVDNSPKSCDHNNLARLAVLLFL